MFSTQDDLLKSLKWNISCSQPIEPKYFFRKLSNVCVTQESTLTRYTLTVMSGFCPLCKGGDDGVGIVPGCWCWLLWTQWHRHSDTQLNRKYPSACNHCCLWTAFIPCSLSNRSWFLFLFFLWERTSLYISFFAPQLPGMWFSVLETSAEISYVSLVTWGQSLEPMWR